MDKDMNLQELIKARHELVDRMKKELSKKWRFNEKKFQRMNEKYNNLSYKIKMLKNGGKIWSSKENHAKKE
jgi:uncharacterized protein YdcH (DUF465 family)